MFCKQQIILRFNVVIEAVSSQVQLIINVTRKIYNILLQKKAASQNMRGY
jgi:hypothetical protein